MLTQLRKLRHTVIPLPVKYGRRFRLVSAFLRRHQRSSRQELEAYQWQRFQQLLTYAYEHVPFYRQRFDQLGLQPDDIRTRAELRLIPPLTKDEVLENEELLKSDEFDQLQPIPTVTSGTTRDRMRLYRSTEAETWRMAIVWRHFHNLGYQFRDKRAQITMPIKFITDRSEMPIDYNENALLIDPRAFTLEHSRKVYDRLVRFQPKMVFCQPENLVILIKYFQEQKLPAWPLPLVHTLGEQLYPEYRSVIESYFGTKVYDYYGNRENTVAAGELTDGLMHIQTEFCLLEFVDEQGEEVVDHPADIISTSLVNYAFPLIRYQTEDVGIYRGYPKGAINDYPVMEIYGGRGKDLLLSRRGLFCPQIYYLFDEHEFTRFSRLQLEQLSIDELLLRMVPTGDFRHPEDIHFLERLFTDYFKGEFKIEVRLVDSIPRPDSCKNKIVHSRLAMEELRSRC